MSHHHMLPPIVYVPQRSRRRSNRRKSRIRMHGAHGVDDAGEVGAGLNPASRQLRPAICLRLKILCRSRVPKESRSSRRDASATAR